MCDIKRASFGLVLPFPFIVDEKWWSSSKVNILGNKCCFWCVCCLKSDVWLLAILWRVGNLLDLTWWILREYRRISSCFLRAEGVYGLLEPPSELRNSLIWRYRKFGVLYRIITVWKIGRVSECYPGGPFWRHFAVVDSKIGLKFSK